MTGKSTKKTRRKYDDSFKEDVLKMIMSGRPVSEVSEALGISENLIYTWKKKAHKGTGNGNGSPGGYSADAAAEIERLRAELRRAEQERDILKKALVVFSRGT
ncbi:transposase [Flavitalea flava]